MCVGFIYFQIDKVNTFIHFLLYVLRKLHEFSEMAIFYNLKAIYLLDENFIPLQFLQINSHSITDESVPETLIKDTKGRSYF